MRRRASVVVGVLVGAVLVTVPASAQAAEPTVRTSGDDVTYTDPTLAGTDTTRVRGVLREVVTEPAAPVSTGSDPHAGHDHTGGQPLIVLADGTHVPVDLDLDAPDVVGSTVVAELVDGPVLDAALDGTPTEPVQVRTAQVDTAEAAAARAPHRVYVAVVGNSGASVDSDATIQARVDGGTRWWSEESGTSFGTASTVRYDSALDATQRCGFANPWTLWSEAGRRFPDGTFDQPGNHLLVVVDDTCNGVGVGTVGRGMDDGGSSTQKESASIFTATFAHEVGHNLGLNHANLESLDGQGGEYWDLYSPMGLAIGSSQSLDPPALDSEYRAQLGLLYTGEVEVVGSGTSVTRTLAARGSSTGLRGMEVRSPDGTSHWVEYRSGGGRDARSYYRLEPNASVSGTRKYPRGVTVSTRTTGSTGSTLLRPRADGTVAHGSRQAGQTYTAGDVSVRVDSVGAESAVVTVTNGPVLADLATSTPVVEGTPRVGATLTAQPGSWTTGTTFAYQWFAGGTAVQGATASTFVPTKDQLGRTITVRVTGSRSGHRSATRESAPTPAVAAGVLDASTPTVEGAARVGSPLTGRAGSWTAGTTLTYQWSAGGVDVPAATTSTFTPTVAQLDDAITLTVTGTKDGYTTTSRTSQPTERVAAGATTAGAPTVTGTPRVGEQLGVDVGSWGPGTTFTYQWLADGSPVTGATGATFTPGPVQQGARVTVTVTGARPGYDTSSATSAPTDRVATGTQVAGTPTVSGDPTVGRPLRADPGTWASGTMLTYQWLADGSPVADATTDTFTPGPAQRGARMTVTVTGERSGYDTASATSEPTTAVAAGATIAGRPAVTGTAKVGVALGVDVGSWAPGTTFTYQWLADDAPVAGATSRTFTPGAATVGDRITVRVTGTRDGYETASAISGPSAAVAAGTLTASTPKVSGAAVVGRRLSVVRGTWTSGTTFSYRWLANGTAVKGATASTFVVPRSLRGKRVTVQVTGRKSGYTTLTRTSARTGVVR